MSTSLKFNTTPYCTGLGPTFLPPAVPALFPLCSHGPAKWPFYFGSTAKALGFTASGQLEGQGQRGPLPPPLPPLPPSHSPSPSLSISGPPSALLNYFGPNGPLRICSQHRRFRGPVPMSSRSLPSKLNALAFKEKVTSTIRRGFVCKNGRLWYSTLLICKCRGFKILGKGHSAKSKLKSSPQGWAGG